MHLQSPKGVERGRQPPARSILHSAWIRFYPLLTPPSFLPPHVFVLNIHLLAHLRQRQLAAQVFSVFIRTPTRNLSMYKGTKHTSSLYIRGEKKNKKQKTKKQKQARCIRHKDYTLISVHTAHCTDTMATSPMAP